MELDGLRIADLTPMLAECFVLAPGPTAAFCMPVGTRLLPKHAEHVHHN